MRAVLALSIGIILGTATAAQAATQRAFVSVFGNDANTAANCSIASPCRSFGAAIGVTNANGEVIVVDSGGYGPVTITQGVTIQAPAGVYAGITAGAGQNGVTITATNAKVNLRGLSINGQGGDRGIALFTSGVNLVVERCTITNMLLDGIIAFSVGGTLYVSDTVVANGGTFGINMNNLDVFEGNRLTVVRNNNDGIGIANTGVSTIRDSILSENGLYGIEFYAQTAGTVDAAMSRVEVHGNRSGGIGVVVTSTGPAMVSVSDSSLLYNGASAPLNGTIKVNAASPARAEVAVDRTVIQRNFGDGIFISADGGKATVAYSTITSNVGYALNNTGAGTLYTRQTNTIRGNLGSELTSQTFGTITVLPGG